MPTVDDPICISFGDKMRYIMIHHDTSMVIPCQGLPGSSGCWSPNPTPYAPAKTQEASASVPWIVQRSSR